jgi:hypothetical protein
MLTSSIIANNGLKGLLSVNSDTTLTQLVKVVQIDATLGDVTLTLGEITNNTVKNQIMVIDRIDDSTNTVTIIGTGRNFPDEPLDVAIGDSLLIYASDNNNWRTV